MSNHSDETPQAWVWSHYRGELAGGAPVGVDEILSVASPVTAEGSRPSEGSPGATPGIATTAGAYESSVSTGPILAGLILTILGLLWFASADKKHEANAEKGATPPVSTGPESAPAPSSPPPSAGTTAVQTPADPAPAASPAAPESAGERHGSQRRKRRHP